MHVLKLAVWGSEEGMLISGVVNSGSGAGFRATLTVGGGGRLLCSDALGGRIVVKKCLQGSSGGVIPHNNCGYALWNKLLGSAHSPWPVA